MSSIRSEIRKSTITALLDKCKNNKYGKFIKKVHLIKVRSFDNQFVQFDFPVTALVGPNGGGKTTILGACAILYQSLTPRTFFTRNKHFDHEMKDWRIEYEVIDRDVRKTDILRRSASYHLVKWDRKSLDREVLFFGVSRTLPAVERKELSRFATTGGMFSEEQIQEISDSDAVFISRILGKDVHGFAIAKASFGTSLTLYAGRTKEGRTYSEFHFGAGEATVIKIVQEIEKLNDNALVLIEEIENGLHPVAVYRLIEYLISSAERKSIQVIFSTHSQYALQPLPWEAIWSSVDGRVKQGMLDIMSLRELTGEVEGQLVVFTEDSFSKKWIEIIIRRSCPEMCNATEVVGQAGDGTAVRVQKSRLLDKSISIPSVCFVDGDSMQTPDEENFIFKLPGQAPETFVFDSVVERNTEISMKLTVMLMNDPSQANQERVMEIIENVRQQNMDGHLLYAQVGERLGYIQESTVIEGFITAWCSLYEDETRRIFACLCNRLSDDTRSQLNIKT